MKNSVNSVLKNLAKEIRRNAVKAPKVLHSKKVAVKTSWCGRHSELPTDIAWAKIPRGAFDTHKREKGNNRNLQAAICQAAYNRKRGI